MAEPIAPKITKLPPERRQQLVDSRKQMEDAQHSIDVLKKIGMDVTPLQEKLDWAKDTADILLAEF